MKFFPRSLLWRTALVVSVTLIAGQVLWLQVVRHYQTRQGIQQITQQLAATIEMQRQAIEAIPESARAAYKQRIAQVGRIRFVPAVAGVQPGREPTGPIGTGLAEALRASLGDNVEVRTEELPDRAGRIMWVRLPIAGEDTWVVLPPRHAIPPQSWLWLEWGLMTLLLAIGASVLVILRIRAPLRELSQAALQIGRGETPPPMGGRGPSEIDELQKSFAQMQADLKRLENDRALVLAGISHDLRTPLSRMRLSAEMLSTDPSTREGMVSDIEEIDAIINQFLDFARDSAGEAPQIVNVNALVSAVSDHYGKLQHDIVLALGAVPALPLRAVGMRRLITNLVDNSLRYGGGRVEVETRHDRDGARNEVVIEVRDRGPGIAGADLERVKQPFTRLDPSRGGGGGAGLGLAIAERVVRLHGGTLELAARDGGGLVARVRLPLRES